MKRFPYVATCLIAGASLVALAGVSKADDHLFQAQQHGLSGVSETSHPFVANKNNHSGDLAAGQGSPFIGADTQTPSTDNPVANLNANIKDRTPK